MRRHAWILYVVVGVLALAVWQLVPALQTGPIFSTIAVAAPFATILAVRLWRPAVRWPWYLFAFGQMLFVVDDVISSTGGQLFRGAAPEWLANLAPMAAYPCLIAGIFFAAVTEEHARRRSEARFASLVRNSSDMVIVVDAGGAIRYVSASITRVLGHRPRELEGRQLETLAHSEDAGSIEALLPVEVSVDGSAGTRAEFRVQHVNGDWIHVEALRTNLLEDENVRGIVLNIRDISERKAFEEQLAHQAFTDPVTGLANRALFRDRVEHALQRRSRDGKPVSVLFMDLDDFKTINDSLGHAAGDRLLVEVGERVRAALRTADTTARLGGDEFAVLLEDGGDGARAAEVAVRILDSLEAPFVLEEKEVYVHASIGIASADERSALTALDTDALLRNADAAMYMAKQGGKGRYQVYEPAMHHTALQRLEMKGDLQRALDHGEFVLHYQPVIELATGRITGFEALVRWDRAEGGIVPPLDFVPLAEETGLIVPIGRWVLQEAVATGKRLQDRFPAEPRLNMAVNLSARQIQHPDFIRDVETVLREVGFHPNDLMLEITESVMMDDLDRSIQRLGQLRAIGVRLAVDDFGTGYSSLNYIRRLPIDVLKVDKSFVDGISDGGEESALTAAIIDLAGILHLRPVAEGIERAEQLEQLRALDCELGQGYYFTAPLPVDEVEHLLEARSTHAFAENELSFWA
jgi:diguanylate cyclase (GGDEF)-like protein/PAS domain S-box-containing protein